MNKPEMIFKVIYDAENGDVVPDNKVAAFVKNKIEQAKKTKLPVFAITVGSGLIVQTFRAAIARGDIAPENFVLEVAGKAYEVCDCGNFSDCPDEIYAFADIVAEIMRHRVEKKTCKQICCKHQKEQV